MSAASFSLTGPPAPTPTHLGDLRRALAGWGVTTVVDPRPRSAAPLRAGHQPGRRRSALFTLALGRLPTYEDGAWVWHRRGHPGPRPHRLGVGARAVHEAGLGTAAARQAVPRCVLSAGRPVP